VVAQGIIFPWEESPGSIGQGAGDKPGGRKVTQGPQKTNRPPFGRVRVKRWGKSPPLRLARV